MDSNKITFMTSGLPLETLKTNSRYLINTRIYLTFRYETQLLSRTNDMALPPLGSIPQLYYNEFIIYCFLLHRFYDIQKVAINLILWRECIRMDDLLWSAACYELMLKLLQG